jgi:hypothetical protein
LYIKNSSCQGKGSAKVGYGLGISKEKSKIAERKQYKQKCGHSEKLYQRSPWPAE